MRETTVDTGIARKLRSRLRLAYIDHVPKDVRDAILIRRRKNAWKEAGIIFVHVPKNAGSSIVEEVYGRFLGHMPAKSIKRFARKEFQTIPSFALLRDPITRSQSAWRFARAGYGQGEGIIAGIHRPERYLENSFETFERFVTSWLRFQKIDKIDPVFQPQSNYICDIGGKVLVDHLGRLDRLKETEEWISSTIGRNVNIGHTNTTRKESKCSLNISNEAIEIIRKIYKNDFELLSKYS